MSTIVPNLKASGEKCETCPIRHRAVCSYSSPSELSELNDAKYYRDFRPGEEIVGEQEPMTAVGSLIDGVASLYKTLEDGRRQMVGLLFPSDFIGRPMRSHAPYEAVAVTPVRMCLFHRQKFEAILRSNTSLERRMLEMTLDELDAARDWMLLLGRKSARERLASFLMILIRRRAELMKVNAEDVREIDLPLTREAIAEFIGLTIETVSRQFSLLRKQGLIGQIDRRTLSVGDYDALSTTAGDYGPLSSDAAIA
ncbi:MAG: helix-turn-helix domain-containing protein [Pseudomonadota bacterium]